MLELLFYRAAPLAGFLLRRGPLPLEKNAIETGLHFVLSDARRAGELDFMEGRTLAIHAPDIGRRWVFRGRSGRIELAPDVSEADASISGNVKEFILLASRREDPDTLFFHRRLNIEGDTELSLAIKNLLDSLAPDVLPKLLQRFLNCVGGWVEKYHR